MPTALTRSKPIPYADRAAISPAEVAEWSGLSRRTITAHISSGALPVRRIGRRVLVRPSDVLAWLDRAVPKKQSQTSEEAV